MSTPQVWLRDPSLQQAMRLAAIFAAIKLLVHVATNLWQAHLGYGYFRDELYYMVCGQRLAWGYVDHGPLVAMQARLAVLLFGKSLAGIRMLSAFASGGRVFLTGMLAWSLGGRRPAQGLAMLSVLLAPMYLTTDGFLSMNSVESLFWMGCLLAVIAIERGAGPRTWLWVGAAAGIGLLNKPSIAFFLCALLLALLFRPQRTLLYSRWVAAAAALFAVIVLPYALWQMHHHWATLEFLHAHHGSSRILSSATLRFMAIQVLDLLPPSVLVWGVGLLWLLFSPSAKEWRWLGLVYVFFLVIMLRLDPKNYYTAPIYPLLFAAGGVAWERHFHRARRVLEDRVLAFPWMTAVLGLCCVLLLPLALPVLPPRTVLAYITKTQLYRLSDGSEVRAHRLPETLSDRFGWQQEVDEVTHIYNSLSPQDQARVAILCSNYGEASAINILGHGLPVAISGNKTYFLWGPHGATGELAIVISSGTLEQLRKTYASVEVAGHMDDPRASSFEQKNIYLARGRVPGITEAWDSFKQY